VNERQGTRRAVCSNARRGLSLAIQVTLAFGDDLASELNQREGLVVGANAIIKQLVDQPVELNFRFLAGRGIRIVGVLETVEQFRQTAMSSGETVLRASADSDIEGSR